MHRNLHPSSWGREWAQHRVILGMTLLELLDLIIADNGHISQTGSKSWYLSDWSGQAATVLFLSFFFFFKSLTTFYFHCLVKYTTIFGNIIALSLNTLIWKARHLLISILWYVFHFKFTNWKTGPEIRMSWVDLRSQKPKLAPVSSFQLSPLPLSLFTPELMKSQHLWSCFQSHLDHCPRNL